MGSRLNLLNLSLKLVVRVAPLLVGWCGLVWVGLGSGKVVCVVLFHFVGFAVFMCLQASEAGTLRS